LNGIKGHFDIFIKTGILSSYQLKLLKENVIEHISKKDYNSFSVKTSTQTKPFAEVEFILQKKKKRVGFIITSDNFLEVNDPEDKITAVFTQGYNQLVKNFPNNYKFIIFDLSNSRSELTNFKHENDFVSVLYGSKTTIAKYSPSFGTLEKYNKWVKSIIKQSRIVVNDKNRKRKGFKQTIKKYLISNLNTYPNECLSFLSKEGIFFRGYNELNGVFVRNKELILYPNPYVRDEILIPDKKLLRLFKLTENKKKHSQSPPSEE